MVDNAGNKVGSTATIFPIVVAGGRAIDVLRSITTIHDFRSSLKQDVDLLRAAAGVPKMVNIYGYILPGIRLRRQKDRS